MDAAASLCVKTEKNKNKEAKQQILQVWTGQGHIKGFYLFTVGLTSILRRLLESGVTGEAERCFTRHSQEG